MGESLPPQKRRGGWFRLRRLSSHNAIREGLIICVSRQFTSPILRLSQLFHLSLSVSKSSDDVLRSTSCCVLPHTENHSSVNSSLSLPLFSIFFTVRIPCVPIRPADVSSTPLAGGHTLLPTPPPRPPLVRRDRQQQQQQQQAGGEGDSSRHIRRPSLLRPRRLFANDVGDDVPTEDTTTTAAGVHGTTSPGNINSNNDADNSGYCFSTIGNGSIRLSREAVGKWISGAVAVQSPPSSLQQAAAVAPAPRRRRTTMAPATFSLHVRLAIREEDRGDPNMLSFTPVRANEEVTWPSLYVTYNWSVDNNDYAASHY